MERPKTKICTVCHHEQDMSQFRFQKHGKHGTTARCRDCELVYSRKYTAKRYEEEPDHYYRKHLKRCYHITFEDYNRILAEQGGVCAICRTKPPEKRLAVDHDHRCCPKRGQVNRSCGKCVRGLLCTPCNVSLGALKNDPTIFRLAIEYIEKWNNKTTR